LNQKNLIDINKYLEYLNLLKENFVGIQEQIVIFNDTIDKLRGLYRKNPKQFSSNDINNINNIKEIITNKIGSTLLDCSIDRGRKVPIGTNGLLVMHKELYYVGTIDIFKSKGRKYCITLQNGENRLALENEIHNIGVIKEPYKFVQLPTMKKPEIPIPDSPEKPYKKPAETPLKDGCVSCKYRDECVRRRHTNGICDEFERGPAIFISNYISDGTKE
jgi:hypothetical protein